MLEALGLVLREGDAAVLDFLDVVDEELVVAAHLLRGLVALLFFELGT